MDVERKKMNKKEAECMAAFMDSVYTRGYQDGSAKATEVLMEHLYSMPWDEALKEIADYAGERDRKKGGNDGNK